MNEEMTDTEARLLVLEQALRAIQLRNERVELDKAWEVSVTRRAAIAVLTYCITYGVFTALDVASPGRSALIPTVGYLLSTLTLPLVRRYWLGRSIIDP